MGNFEQPNKCIIRIHKKEKKIEGIFKNLRRHYCQNFQNLIMICFDVFSLWFLMHGVHGDNCRGGVLEAPELGLP